MRSFPTNSRVIRLIRNPKTAVPLSKIVSSGALQFGDLLLPCISQCDWTLRAVLRRVQLGTLGRRLRSLEIRNIAVDSIFEQPVNPADSLRCMDNPSYTNALGPRAHKETKAQFRRPLRSHQAVARESRDRITVPIEIGDVQLAYPTARF
jgi:hypothetical protein